MIKKCEHPGCTKAGTCRAPKTRDLRDYWYFCQEHAAEYNKNWNYYADMSPEEIEADWERQVFGTADIDRARANQNAKDYAKFIEDFLTGRSTFDRQAAPKSNLPASVIGAFKVFDLPLTASQREIGARYRALAKKYHPDTASDKSAAGQFSKITAAYEVLKRHFGKK